MKVIILNVVVALLLLSLAACKGKNEEIKVVSLSYVELKYPDSQFIEGTSFEGFVLGCSPEQDEVYINSSIKTGKGHKVLIINLKDGSVIKEFNLASGGFQSPTLFQNPTFMQKVGDKYIIYDHMSKIVLFNQELKYLFTSMHHEYREFVDFFSSENQIYFIISSRIMKYKDMDCVQSIYKIGKVKKPEEIKKIGKIEIPLIDHKNAGNRKNYYSGVFWPYISGFENNGKIYYSSSNERIVRIFDLKTKQLKKKYYWIS